MKKIILIFILVFNANILFAQTFPILRLETNIRNASIPIDGVSGLVCGSPNKARIDFKNTATAQNITDANNILLAFDCSQNAQTSFDNLVSRTSAKNLVDTSKTDRDKLIRAVAAVLLDELNLHALKINAILDAVDGAGTLAALKTSVAAIPDYPQRTLQQTITAVKSKLDAGSVD